MIKILTCQFLSGFAKERSGGSTDGGVGASEVGCQIGMQIALAPLLMAVFWIPRRGERVLDGTVGSLRLLQKYNRYPKGGGCSLGGISGTAVLQLYSCVTLSLAVYALCGSWRARPRPSRPAWPRARPRARAPEPLVALQPTPRGHGRRRSRLTTPARWQALLIILRGP